MPELSFVMPHWLYWLGLIAVPLAAMITYRLTANTQPDKAVSLPLAYFLLICGGIVGVHRLYLKSFWALSFITLFTVIQFVNVEVRDARETLSQAENDVQLAEFRIKRAEISLQKGRRGAEEKKAEAEAFLVEAQDNLKQVNEDNAQLNNLSSGIGGALLLLILVDALLLPKLVRDRNRVEKPPREEDCFHCPAEGPVYSIDDEPNGFNRLVARINGFAGEFVAYWSMIAVFVYYYEVMARYVFNSPTNWAHESMFLMFGMQYLLAGGYVLREGGHVRVDVIYMHLPRRVQAGIDVVTSLFFFIFSTTLMITGWTFFSDAYEVREVSFTEWHIQYWPIKFALPLGAALILVQGIAQLIKDIAAFIHPTDDSHPSQATGA